MFNTPPLGTGLISGSALKIAAVFLEYLWVPSYRCLMFARHVDTLDATVLFLHSRSTEANMVHDLA